MKENRKNNEPEIIYNQTLKGVFRDDFIPTVMTIREMYVPGFNSTSLTGFFDGLTWLKNADNMRVFMGTDLDEDTDRLPKNVKDFRHTLKLYLDLRNEVGDGNRSIMNIPVAYPWHDKENMTQDLKKSTEDVWYKFKNDPKYQDVDALSAKTLSAYW